MKIFLYFLTLALAGLVGCNDNSPPPKTGELVINNDVSFHNTSPLTLPSDARNITDRGNGWITFDVTIKGKDRTFLFARYVTKHGYATGTLS